MDNQSEQTGLSVQKTDRLAVVMLFLGFLFLCAGLIVILVNLAVSPLFGILLVGVGFVGIIYGSINIKLYAQQQSESSLEASYPGSLRENWLMIGFLASFVPGLYWFFVLETGSGIAFLFGLGGFPGGMIGAAIGNALGNLMRKQKMVIVWVGAVVGACLGSYLGFIMLGGVVV